MGDTFIGYVLVMIYTGMMPGELLGTEVRYPAVWMPEVLWDI